MSEHEKAQKVAMRTDELARLRGENERLKRSFSPRYDDRRDIAAVIEHLRFGDSDGDDHDAAATEIERLQSELTALRRPVEQNTEIEEIRRDQWPVLIEHLTTAGPELLGKLLKDQGNRKAWQIHTLLSFLDTTARQLRERVEMLSFVQDALSERNRENAELKAKCERLEAALREIASNKTRHMEVNHAFCVNTAINALAAADVPALTASQQHTAGSGDGVAIDDHVEPKPAGLAQCYGMVHTPAGGAWIRTQRCALDEGHDGEHQAPKPGVQP